MRTLPTLIRFLAIHAATGVALGWGIVIALLWLDAGGLGTLVSRSTTPIMAVAVLGAFFSITFGSVVMGTAVMLNKDTPSKGGGRRSGVMMLPLVPAHVSANGAPLSSRP